MVETRINRINFGSGKAGESAFKIISNGEPCYECGGQSNLTLDYDVFATLEQIALCNNCVPIAREIIKIDLAKIGRTSSFGFNGKGRA